jgi:ornithine cyclodeaminase/alanine dehydrogenase-like protein (mu-crystallin family)
MFRPMARLLKEHDVKRLLTMVDAIDVVEKAFLAVSRSCAINVPRQRAMLGGVTINTLAAISTVTDTVGVKCYPIVRRDVTVGSSFTMLVYRASSGVLLGILEADTLGQIRTGAASGVATRHLARSESRLACLFGVGWQARTQLEALVCVLGQLERVMLMGRSSDRLAQFCDDMKFLPIELVPCSDPEPAVRQADVLITATGASAPVFDGRWLRPGAHINAVGSNYAEKRELDAVAVRRADCIVVDDIAGAQLESGDLLAPEAGVEWPKVQFLGDVVQGSVPGRTAPDQITLFESQGVGIEDLAVASRVLELAEQNNIGLEIPLR